MYPLKLLFKADGLKPDEVLVFKLGADFDGIAANLTILNVGLIPNGGI
jgi:hypothetical protein